MPTQDFFTPLPDEVKLCILFSLDFSLSELAKLSRVSKSFNRIVSDNSLWKAHLPQEDQEKAVQEITKNYKAYYDKHHNALKAIIDNPEIPSDHKVHHLIFHIQNTTSLLDANIILNHLTFREPILKYTQKYTLYFAVRFACTRKEFALLMLEDREFKQCFLNASDASYWLAEIACSHLEVAFFILNDAEYTECFKKDIKGSSLIHDIAQVLELKASLTREPTNDFLADYESINRILINELVTALDRELKATASIATPTIR